MIDIIINSSLLVILLLVFRKVLMGRVSKKIQYALWILVVCRLLVPGNYFSFVPSVSSLFKMTAGHQNEITSEVKHSTTDIETFFSNNQPMDGHSDASEVKAPGTAFLREEYNYENNQQITEVSENVLVNAGETMTDGSDKNHNIKNNNNMHWYQIVWIAGVILVSVVIIVSNLIFSIKLRRYRTYLETYRGLKVYKTSNVSTSCLYGIFTPQIYLTDECLQDDNTKEMILVHEYTHFKHLDHIWAIVRMLCVCIYWFNPLVWCAAWISKCDGEMACDESVIQVIGREHVAAYGQTLIQMTNLYSYGGLVYMSTGFGGTKRELKERIVELTKNCKKSAVLVAVVIVFALVFGGIAFGKGSVPHDAYNYYRYHISEDKYMDDEYILRSQSNYPGIHFGFITKDNTAKVSFRGPSGKIDLTGFGKSSSDSLYCYKVSQDYYRHAQSDIGTEAFSGFYSEDGKYQIASDKPGYLTLSKEYVVDNTDKTMYIIFPQEISSVTYSFSDHYIQIESQENLANAKVLLYTAGDEIVEQHTFEYELLYGMEIDIFNINATKVRNTVDGVYEPATKDSINFIRKVYGAGILFKDMPFTSTLSINVISENQSILEDDSLLEDKIKNRQAVLEVEVTGVPAENNYDPCYTKRLWYDDNIENRIAIAKKDGQSYIIETRVGLNQYSYKVYCWDGVGISQYESRILDNQQEYEKYMSLWMEDYKVLVDMSNDQVKYATYDDNEIEYILKKPTTMYLSGYTGYIDENDEYTDKEYFQKLDIDKDGLIDRVYRQQLNWEFCNIEVHFGDKSTLLVEKVNDESIPDFILLPSDSNDMLIAFRNYYPGANGEVVHNDMKFFKKENDNYVETPLPFSTNIYADNLDNGIWNQYVSVNVKLIDASNRTVAYTCKEFPEFYEEITMTEEDYRAGDFALQFESAGGNIDCSDSMVYSIENPQDGSNTIICKAHVIYHCSDEIAFVMKYIDGKWQVLEVGMARGKEYED